MKRRMIRLSLAIMFAATLLFTVVASGCHQCKKGTMRCNGTAVQLCAPNHRWKTVVDCSRLKRTKKQYGCVVLPNNRCTCRTKEVKR